MKCRVDKSTISGEIICPQNKSYTHRAIFMASLAGNNSRVDNVLLSSDTIATIEACKNFGAELDMENSSVVIRNSIKLDTKVTQIDAENSGTTIRIAAGIASLFSHEIILTGDSSFTEKTHGPTFRGIVNHRCKI